MSNAEEEVTKKATDFGSVLAAARQSQNYSIDDVCEQLKVPARTVIAIENSDLTALPEATFVQGYLRSYARFLEIPENKVLAMYHQAVPQDATNRLNPRSDLPEEASSRSPLVKTLTILLIVAGVLLAAFGGFQYYQKQAYAIESERAENESGFNGSALESSGDAVASVASVNARPLNTQPINIQPIIIQPIIIQQKARLSEDGALILTQSAPAEKDEIILVSVNEPVVADTALVTRTETASSAEPSVDVLKIYAAQGSWMQVHDATKTRLLFNMIPIGGEKTLMGQAPFRISLGNAKTTKLVINGIAIDMSAYLRENNTARFTVSTKQQGIIFH